MRARGRVVARIAVLAVAIACLAGRAAGGPPPQDEFAAKQAAYEAEIKRPSLRKRTDGRVAFAATRDLRALRILAQSYDRAEEPADEVRYLLANICTAHFPGANASPTYAEWRGRDSKPQDAWLWHKTLVVGIGVGEKEEALRAARSAPSPFLRAAAVEALAAKDFLDVLPLAAEILGSLPDDPTARAVLAEACASAVLSQGAHVGEPVFHDPAARLIRLLDDRATLPRTKLVIARFLSRVFDTPKQFLEGQPWHRMLLVAEAQEEAKPVDDPYAPPKRPTFGGIEATGTRIAYVIDASDSMMAPIAVEVLTELRKPKGPVTRGDDEPTPDLGGAGPDGGPRDPAKDPLTAGGEVDWKKVKTRFDAARALLTASLRALEPEKSFAVILFGTKAEPLQATQGMVQATPAAISRAIQELNAIKPDSATPMRPLGRIRGETNLHGGLCRAFQLKGRGLVRPWEYVSPDALMEGCDTVFVLSDGAPSMDDWLATDRRDPTDHAGDPETHTRQMDTPNLHFPGPFSFGGRVVDEVRRLNLFRKAEIHCVGIGEANVSLLGQIAEVGLGKVRTVGLAKGDGAK